MEALRKKFLDAADLGRDAAGRAAGHFRDRFGVVPFEVEQDYLPVLRPKAMDHFVQLPGCHLSVAFVLDFYGRSLFETDPVPPHRSHHVGGSDVVCDPVHPRSQGAAPVVLPEAAPQCHVNLLQ